MVRVGSLFVDSGPESLDPVGQLADERDRHMRCPERRNHVEVRCFQVDHAVDAEDGEPPQRARAEVIDLGVGLGVQR